jgi:DNA-binding MarR family transcriptional regulator
MERAGPLARGRHKSDLNFERKDAMNKPEPALTEMNTWNFCTNAAIRRASRRLGQLYAEILAPAGLRTTQYTLLAQTKLLGEPTMRQLANAMVMDLSALGHTLKPLERDGLLTLVPDEKDRRARRARLTPKGLAKLAEGTALWHKAQSRFDAEFGAKKSAALRRALDLISSDESAAKFTAAGN